MSACVSMKELVNVGLAETDTPEPPNFSVSVVLPIPLSPRFHLVCDYE